MADLGPVAISGGDALFSRPIVHPLVYRQLYSIGVKAVNIDISGSLSGTVTVGGTPAPGVMMALLWRSSMSTIATEYTDASGNYDFPNLDATDLAAYLVVVRDPASASPFNYSQAHDHLTAD